MFSHERVVRNRADSVFPAQITAEVSDGKALAAEQ
jgi:hypothetical protein